jgi:integration host factor subunit beta
MNKQEFARNLAQKFGFTQREGQVIMDGIINALAQELAHGRRAELRGLGTFGVQERRPSVGRVVRTGTPVAIPALRRVFFRPGRELKQIRPAVQPPKSA